MGVIDRFKRAYNAFAPLEEPDSLEPYGHIRSEGTYGGSFTSRPDRVRMQFTSDRSIVTSIYTRISIDIASVMIKHVRLDDQDRYLQDMVSGLNNCLTVEANLDQAARAFRQDFALTLCDKGVVALVPIDTSLDPKESASFDILTLRVGHIVKWYPKHVKVSVYNEEKGKREEITLPKSIVCIVENPLYAVMNEPNSTLQRLMRKLSLLDSVDENSASGKLDLIIQLPYVIKSEARKQQAEQRRNDIEFQLKGSKYGIAYTDGTEKITQLNRPVENNLLVQIKDLKEQLYGELGITAEVMNGTADEKTMLNYWNRTIEPMLDAVVEEMRRKFLTKTARSQKQSVEYFQDPFKLVPIGNIADIGDKMTRNEILTSNEMRQILGRKPSSDPKADELRNSNMPQPGEILPAPGDIEGEVVEDVEDDGVDETEQIMTDAFDSVDAGLDDIFKELGVDEDSL